MTSKTILIANLGRIEKLLIFNLLLHNEIKILGIVSNFTPKRVIAFLERDSNHGKFLLNKIFIQISKETTKIIFELNEKKVAINLYQEKELKLILLNEKSIDLLVDFSQNLKMIKLNLYTKIAKKVLVLEDPILMLKKPGKQIGFHFNHGQIENQASSFNIIYHPPIEAIILAIFIKSLKEKWKITSFFYDIVAGPRLNMAVLDNLNEKTALIYNRALFNNIIPDAFSKVKTSLLKLLEMEKITLSISGRGCYVPATTGALLTLTCKVEKSFSIKEINNLLSQESDAQIGFAKKQLVSQDIVSTHYYAIMDQSLTSVSANKEFVQIAFWYDYESSLAISIFKLLQYLSGLKI